MRKVCAAIVWAGLGSAAFASDLKQPHFTSGDVWVYDEVVEKGTTSRETHQQITIEEPRGDQLLIEMQDLEPPGPRREQLVGADWSRIRSVNGHQQVVNRPFAFPLALNKTWRIDFTEDNPNPQHLRERIESPYKVLGWEEIDIAAGHFRALKIESIGAWSADLPARVDTSAVVMRNQDKSAVVTRRTNIAATTGGGRLYKAFWYAPEVKRWVKATEEYYNSQGARTERYSSELESYKVASP